MIPEERLEALPKTRLCVTCSTAVGGEFIRTVAHERTSKPGSLKRNYGSVNIQETRKPIEPLDGN
jgi:hypothetical protein